MPTLGKFFFFEKQMQRENQAYTLKTRDIARRHGRQIQRTGETVYKNNIIKSLSELARQMNVKISTLSSWMNKDWSKKAVKDRLKKRGKKRTLSEEQEEELLDWVVRKNAKGDPPNADEICDYCADNFEWKPQRPWVSKWAKKHRVSSKLTQKKPAKRNRDSSLAEINDFRREINDQTALLKRGKRHVPCVWTVDEFGVHDDEIRRRGYSPIGTTPQKVSWFLF